MAGRVLDEDARHLKDALLVCERDGRPVDVGGEDVLLSLGDGTELLADRARALGDVDLGLLDRELAGVEAREVEKVGRQLA